MSEVHPKAKLWELTMTLKTFIIKNPDPGDSLFPNLMGPQYIVGEGMDSDDKNFLSIEFGQRQQHGKCFYNVSVNMQPSNVVYKFAAVTKVKHFFGMFWASKLLEFI